MPILLFKCACVCSKTCQREVGEFKNYQNVTNVVYECPLMVWVKKRGRVFSSVCLYQSLPQMG